jgi:hypothetical protein
MMLVLTGYKRRFSVGRWIFRFSVFLFLAGSSLHAVSQTLQLEGTIYKDNKKIDNVEIKVLNDGKVIRNEVCKPNGTFKFMVDLQKKYLVVFSKPGLISKSIEVTAIVPQDMVTEIFLWQPFRVDLYEDVGDVSHSDAMNKPTAKITYNPVYEDFDFDKSYTDKIKAEQEAQLKAADAKRQLADKARLDSLNKVWSDSLARAKTTAAAAAAAKAEADRLAKLQQDSIAKAKADALARAKAEAAEMARLAALQAARQDSINKADAAEKARLAAAEKAKQEAGCESEAGSRPAGKGKGRS